jgi:hypothetical protein
MTMIKAKFKTVRGKLYNINYDDNDLLYMASVKNRLIYNRSFTALCRMISRMEVIIWLIE